MDTLTHHIDFFRAFLKEAEPVLLYQIFIRQSLFSNFSAYWPTSIISQGKEETEFKFLQFWEGSKWNKGLHADEEWLADLTRCVAGGPINTVSNWCQLKTSVCCLFQGVRDDQHRQDLAEKETSL